MANTEAENFWVQNTISFLHLLIMPLCQFQTFGPDIFPPLLWTIANTHAIPTDLTKGYGLI